MLIALEGLDGAGKRTLVGKVVARLEADGLDVATLDFPRYGTSIHADLASRPSKARTATECVGARDGGDVRPRRAGAADRLRDLVAAHES